MAASLLQHVFLGRGCPRHPQEGRPRETQPGLALQMQREGGADPRADPLFGLDPKLTVMGSHDALGDAEPNPATAALRRVSWREDTP